MRRRQNISEMVLVEEDAHTIATVHDLELEEIIELSLKGVTISKTEMDCCSQWVANNIQNFGKMMEVSLGGMKNLSYLFFL